MVTVSIMSFSYMHGVPEDETGHGGGFVFDCRCLPNPFWDEGLRRCSGKDEPVREFFARHREEVEAFAGAAEALVRQTIRVFQSDGRQHLQVAFGCTGGNTAPCSWPRSWRGVSGECRAWRRRWCTRRQAHGRRGRKNDSRASRR